MCSKAARTRRSTRACSTRASKEIFGAGTPFYGWHYPPFFLRSRRALALMPYQLALIVWQAVTLVLYLLRDPRDRRASSWPGLSRPSTSYLASSPQVVDARAKPGHDGVWLLLALAFPAVFVNLGHGHNGFLTAALIGFALVWLDRRPVLAGILFGLLAYKPQFGLMIPLVLLATGRWRTVFAAAATVAALALAATLAFGIETWRAFFTSADFTRAIVLETRRDRLAHDPERVLLGAHVGRARAARLRGAGRATLGIAAALVWLWRSHARFALKAAALCLAAILATPYSLDYDMMVLAPAIAFLDGRRPRARLRPVREDRARGALDRPADRAQRRAGDADPARRHRDAR